MLKKHFKQHLILAAPICLSNIGHMITGVADTIMIGKLGTEQLAAVALATAFFNIIMVFIIGLTQGITPPIAQMDGERNYSKLAIWTVNCIIYLVLASMLLSLFSFFSEDILLLAGQKADVAARSADYLFYVFPSVIGIALYMSVKQAAEGLSDTRIAMIISIAGNLFNIVLNYLLIFGKAGFPTMGLEGAGLATLIARLTMGFAMLLVFRTNKKLKTKVLPSLSFKLKLEPLKKLFSIGMPIGLQLLFEVGAFSGAALIVGLISENALAAHQIALNVPALTFMVVMGLSAAGTVRVGNAVGKKSLDELKMASKSALILMVIWLSITSASIYLLRDELPKLFIDNQEVIGIASTLLIVAAIFQFPDGFQALGIGLLRGIEDVKIPTFFTLIAYWLVALPLGYFLGVVLWDDAKGVWIGLSIGLTLASIFHLGRFYKMAPRKIKKEQGSSFKDDRPAPLEEGALV